MGLLVSPGIDVTIESKYELERLEYVSQIGMHSLVSRGQSGTGDGSR